MYCKGAMLAKRDQERYRRAMQDLRDYDIFKEVMETAMVKLQNELTEVVTENQVCDIIVTYTVVL